MLNEPDLAFASLVVQVCMLVLMTGNCTRLLRAELRGKTPGLATVSDDSIDNTLVGEKEPDEVSREGVYLYI
jgi:hypothetical protein